MMGMPTPAEIAAAAAFASNGAMFYPHAAAAAVAQQAMMQPVSLSFKGSRSVGYR